jgi:hypothetical protein
MSVLLGLFNALFSLYIFWDARRRRSRGWWAWALFGASVGPLALPFYFAKRPLMEGEIRSGGTGWNVLKNFVLLWTVALSLVGAVFAIVGEPGAIAIGWSILLFLWLAPTLLGGLIGFFLKTGRTEEGPTGPLAEKEMA